MLLTFNFKNFRSFRDEAVLDLQATKVTEHVERVAKEAGERILPCATLYGANASGKSNVYYALKFMRNYVLESFGYGGTKDQDEYRRDQKQQHYFLFEKDAQLRPSEFEVVFTAPWFKDTTKTYVYQYGFVLEEGIVLREWLFTKSPTARKFRPLFEREGQKLDFHDIAASHELWKAGIENLDAALNLETLVVSLGSKLKVAALELVYRWFSSILMANFGDPFENYETARRLPPGFTQSSEIRHQVVEYLNAFDPAIQGFDVIELPKRDDEKSAQYNVSAFHQMIDSKGTGKLPLVEESHGTLKMFSLYGLLQKILSIGGLLFIDELDARLHPLLVRSILITFLNPETNPLHAQLIFTTHDATLLQENLLRRDEVWFIEKDEKGQSSLYSLSDLRNNDDSGIRRDENQMKNYLVGKYGGIPELSRLMNSSPVR